MKMNFNFFCHPTFDGMNFVGIIFKSCDHSESVEMNIVQHYIHDIITVTSSASTSETTSGTSQTSSMQRHLPISINPDVYHTLTVTIEKYHESAAKLSVYKDPWPRTQDTMRPLPFYNDFQIFSNKDVPDMLDYTNHGGFIRTGITRVIWVI